MDIGSVSVLRDRLQRKFRSQPKLFLAKSRELIAGS